MGAISMVELLVAVLVTSVGLLGIAGAQLNSLRTTNDLMERTQATELAHDMIDRLRVDKAVALTGAYNSPYVAEEGQVTPSTFAGLEVASWKATLTQLITTGQGRISVTNGTAEVGVRWGDQSVANFRELVIEADL